MLFPGKLRLTQGHNKHFLSNNLILGYIIFKLTQFYKDHWKYSKLLKLVDTGNEMPQSNAVSRSQQTTAMISVWLNLRNSLKGNLMLQSFYVIVSEF